MVHNAIPRCYSCARPCRGAKFRTRNLCHYRAAVMACGSADCGAQSQIALQPASTAAPSSDPRFLMAICGVFAQCRLAGTVLQLVAEGQEWLDY
jgi:hypothetical protein